MIVINECNIIGNKLIIEATVDNLSYYADVEIGSVIIDSDETYSESGPSDEPLYSQEFDTVYAASDSDTDIIANKHIRLILSPSDLGLTSLKENIFFIYINCVGYPDSYVPCGMDNSYVIACAFDWGGIYKGALQSIKEIDNKCGIPMNFINYMLQFKAMELALKTGNFTAALKYWKKFINSSSSIGSISNCGCNDS